VGGSLVDSPETFGAKTWSDSNVHNKSVTMHSDKNLEFLDDQPDSEIPTAILFLQASSLGREALVPSLKSLPLARVQSHQTRNGTFCNWSLFHALKSFHAHHRESTESWPLQSSLKCVPSLPEKADVSGKVLGLLVFSAQDSSQEL